jgi:putative ABC transport system permease protein
MRSEAPPRVARAILRRLLEPGICSGALGDLEEQFMRIRKKRGRFLASLHYWLQIPAAFPGFIQNHVYWSFAMLRSNLKIFFRNLRRHKGYSLINIVGLAVGMACCLLIALWVQDELSYDRFHAESHRLGRVVQRPGIPGETPWAVTEGPLAESLQSGYPEIERAVRIQLGRQMRIRYGEKEYEERRNMFVEPAFFEMFSFPLIQGNAETALIDKHSIVLTEAMAAKYFGNENPLGKTLVIGRRLNFQVTGVLADVPSNSHLQFDFVVPFRWMEDLGQRIDEWGNSNFYTYVLLKSGTDFEDVSDKIKSYMTSVDPQNQSQLFIQPLTKIHLHSHFDYDVLAAHNQDIGYVYIFSTVALFVLIIACFNFINLTTARSGNRAREVGLRKIVGAHRADIIRQFFGETSFLTIVALGLAIGLVALVLPAYNELSGKNMSWDTLQSAWPLAALVGIVLFTGALSGSYPAFFLSGFQPVKVLKGRLAAGAKNPFLRRGLVVVQFSLSIILLVGAFVVRDQLRYMQNKDLGFNRENLIQVPMTLQVRRSYEALRTELLSHPEIIQVTAGSNHPAYGRNWASTILNWEGRDPERPIMVQGTDVDYDFIETFQMNMSAGRAFSREFPTDETQGVILNETAVKAMDLTDPVGKWIEMGEWRGTIIGVVEDYNFKSLHDSIEPLILTMANRQLNFLFLRIRGLRSQETLKFLESQWEKVSPGARFRFVFVNDLLNSLYQSERRVGKLLNIFMVLATGIACLGLLGLVSYLAEQRTKEIGIRKVLGASASGIVVLLTKDFLKGILLANLLAWPVAFLVMRSWLKNFAYHTQISVWVFPVSAAAMVGLALLTVCVQTFKAASTNPGSAIRYE